MSNNPTRGASLRAALILNAVFLVLTAVIVRVGFESNDDPTLSAFVDGQMANSTAYIPYINIVLGAALKGIYNVLGREIAWHTFCQYALLYAGLTALSFTLCERLGALRLGWMSTASLAIPKPRRCVPWVGWPCCSTPLSGRDGTLSLCASVCCLP